jgi:DNA-binding response OmpR family regulator
MKVLLIEDEKSLADSIESYLKQEGYICEVASDFDSADEKAKLSDYDCVLLDITLPGGNGLDILNNLKKQKPDAAVIIISARNSLDDKIKGLEIGADDYLTKPFHLPELNARLKSVVRRRNFSGSNELVFDEITVNLSEMIARVKGEPLVLTKKEYELLLFFIANTNHVVTKESIAGHLWEKETDMADSFDFIYSHIKNLRKKIMEKGGDDYIHTVYGIGYKFVKK